MLHRYGHATSKADLIGILVCLCRHELNEASNILRRATPRSLVIMDELGRGTSTHDGVAIAYATCAYLLNTVKCLSLFVTHYPSLARLDAAPDAGVGNFHMSFIENDPGADDTSSITFLYSLVVGAAGRSYGLNVARLACIPTALIARASEKSKVRRRVGLLQQLDARAPCQTARLVCPHRHALPGANHNCIDFHVVHC
eukprot:m.1278644 g.1278644  ORF g.1278644 m.1278644 type:complete len:199 (-) comp24765_c0_seq6:152-748(-)